MLVRKVKRGKERKCQKRSKEQKRNHCYYVTIRL